MHLALVMFSHFGGALEQTYVDYCEALRDQGHRVTAILYPGSVAERQLKNSSIDMIGLRNLGRWDFIAVSRLKQQLIQLKPDAVIVHGRRAAALTRKAISGVMPLVMVTDETRYKPVKLADAVFVTTYDQRNILIKDGMAESRVFHIPSMIRCSELPHRPSRHTPPVIGAKGVFANRSGFEYYIDALALLAKKGLPFKAILAGAGSGRAHLKNRASAAGLDKSRLQFMPWTDHKKSFFEQIDFFCVPSLQEPTGIPLLEAFTYGVPVVATDCEGPRDILTPNYDALVVGKEDANALAEALAKLLENQHLSDSLAANAFAKAKLQYAPEIIAERIEKALRIVRDTWPLAGNESRKA